jgi:hypothetical protein
MAPIVASPIRRPAACPVSTLGAPSAVSTSGRVRTPLIRFDEFMAKKTRKQKQRAATRRPGTPAATPRNAAPRQATAPVPVTPRPVPAQVLPDTVLPPPGTELEIESEADENTDENLVATADGASRRRVQRVNPAAQPRPIRGQVTAAALFQPLDSDEAAIPFDRVPYVPRDLRRVAIMASLMVVLILIAAVVVTRINP